MEIRRKEFVLEGLNCAHCASLIEKEIREVSEVISATVNFISKSLVLDIKDKADQESVLSHVKGIISKHEPDVVIKEKSKRILTKVLYLKGLGCAHCSSKIEEAVKALEGVTNANLDFVNSKLTIEINDKTRVNEIIDNIKETATRIEDSIEIFIDYENVMNHSSGIDRRVQAGVLNPDIWGGISKKEILSLAAGIIIFIAALTLNLPFWPEFALFLISYLLIGGEVVFKAIRNIARGQLLDENFLMFIATVGAFAIKEFPEAVGVMLFYQIGEFFQDMAVNRSRRSISALMDIRPDYANVLLGQTERKVSPEEIQIGQIILIKPGEKVPLDGTVIDGKSVLDTSALTGEFVPCEVAVGDSILGGFINKNGLLKVEVTKSFDQSTIARILDLVENASSKKAITENFITKFARYYTPIVVLGAAMLAFIPPILLPGASFAEWINRALVFLVVSCPCALVISIPLSFFGGIGGASRNGILIKGSNYLEALNSVRTIVFDKTGTLTEGVFDVTQISTIGDITKEELLEMAAMAESFSSHPIATSILKAYGKEINKSEICEYQEISGHGVKAVIRGKRIIAGSSRLMEDENIIYSKALTAGTIVYIALERQYVGYIVITDKVRPDAGEALQRLRQAGIKKMVMLTGDNKQVAGRIGEELGFDEVYAELLPDQKVTMLEEIDKKKDPKTKIAFVGDGINDAPVLARADIGIAMGGLGSDAAIEAADIVLMTDEPSKIFGAIRIAQRTRRIVWQNIFFALGIKAAVLVMGAIGIATMWEAVFADVGVALIAILNAMRVYKS